MAVFKCKMCGGTLEFSPGDRIAVCDSCGSKQTLPQLDDNRLRALYERADALRRADDFDGAAAIYGQIVTENADDCEAYWALVLCRYGVEYVEDPATRRRMPTINRAQYTGIFDDENYRAALRHASPDQRALYESEAREINEIQKNILSISQKEEPFDIFICYKETDERGRRTPDSVLANDMYHQLTQAGFKVFFSRITLEDKLGSAYEPYIFAALNSARVMVVLGTRPEYFGAVWVKNEWSRYLALIKSGADKTLIPAYRDMDPYDLPRRIFPFAGAGHVAPRVYAGSHPRRRKDPREIGVAFRGRTRVFAGGRYPAAFEAHFSFSGRQKLEGSGAVLRARAGSRTRKRAGVSI